MSLLGALGMGFLLGGRHATDADHLVAVAAIVSRAQGRGRAWLLGAFWGLGHTATIFVVGVLIIIFKVSIPARLGLALESCVGLMLVFLGAANIAGRWTGSGGITAHSHPDEPHPHFHVPDAETALLAPGAPLRSAFVGMVHGLAGSAAVALLVLAAIPEPWTALFYLLVFGAGTLVGMLLFSAVLEASMTRMALFWQSSERILVTGTGLLSVFFGLYVLYKTLG